MENFTAIIGCGNSNRSDDGVGAYIIQHLQTLPTRRDIRLFDTGTNGMEVMFKARGCQRLILIDASLSGQPSGALHRVPGEQLASAPEPGLNLHNFRWENALYAGRRIFAEQFPDDVCVYLIEAETVALGLHLSEKVKKTADELCAVITQQYWASGINSSKTASTREKNHESCTIRR